MARRATIIAGSQGGRDGTSLSQICRESQHHRFPPPEADSSWRVSGARGAAACGPCRPRTGWRRSFQHDTALLPGFCCPRHCSSVASTTSSELRPSGSGAAERGGRKPAAQWHPRRCRLGRHRLRRRDWPPRCADVGQQWGKQAPTRRQASARRLPNLQPPHRTILPPSSWF